MRREKGYLNKLNLVLVQVSFLRRFARRVKLKLCRFSSRHGREIGPPSFPKSSPHPVHIFRFVKTT